MTAARPIPATAPLTPDQRRVLEELPEYYVEVAAPTDAHRELEALGFVAVIRPPARRLGPSWTAGWRTAVPRAQYRVTAAGREALEAVRRAEDAERAAGGVEAW